ncbi:MAG: hypothetical protein R3D84_07930 [Paracoccaceae bacterium]
MRRCRVGPARSPRDLPDARWQPAAAGAPVLYKGIEVGHIETPRLSATGGAVEADAFIRAPFDQRITSATRFWDTSGFSFNLGPSGVSLNVNSLAALVEGGISFDTLVSGGAPVADRHVFDVYQDEASARQSVFDDPGDEPMRLAIVFDGSVNGLTLGADVRLRGIKVGELVEMGTRIVNRDNRPEVALLAVVELHPALAGRAAQGQRRRGAGPDRRSCRQWFARAAEHREPFGQQSGHRS